MHFDSLSSFDELYGTDTDGLINLRSLPITSPNVGFGVHYEPVEPCVFEQAVTMAAPRTEHWTFIDIGCGKGRALLLASTRQFKRVIGIDFSPTLTSVARHNIDIFSRLHPAQNPICVIDADAAGYAFPSDNILLFLFNPFTAVVMEKVLSNLVEACDKSRAAARVIYVNPKCHALLSAGGSFRTAFYSPIFGIYHLCRRFDG